MARTRSRPLPSGRISNGYALAFAAATGTAGGWILYNQANPTTAALGVSNIVLYAGVYTPLKQITWLNTWVGSLVGAIPPAMGWTAAGGPATMGALVLPAALFIWQIPHFLGLAWLYAADYERAGYRMLPRYDPTGHRTARYMMRYSVMLVPLGAVAVATGVSTWPFALESVAGGLFITYFAAQFASDRKLSSARLVFTRSLWYLPAVCACMMLHRVPQEATEKLTYTVRLPSVSPILLEALVRTAGTALHFPLQTAYYVQTWLAGEDELASCPSKAVCEGTPPGEGAKGGDAAPGEENVEGEGEAQDGVADSQGESIS